MKSTNKIEKTIKGNNTISTKEVAEKPEYTTLNLGPTHPATHGIFQNVLKMDGEIMMDSESTIGYIHRAFEKIAEHKPYYQYTVMTDRLNYCSSPINNMGWLCQLKNYWVLKFRNVWNICVSSLWNCHALPTMLFATVLSVLTAGAMTGFLYIFQYARTHL